MLLLAGGGLTASAQSEPSVADLGFENRFPDGVLFRASAESDSPITEVRLRYEILPDGTRANKKPDFEPGRSVTVQTTLAGEDFYLPPGMVINYYWEVTDADGDTATSEEQSVFYDDVRFDWEKVEGDGVAIYHYAGDDETAAEMHAVAVETIRSMSRLLDTEVPFDVQVWLYDSTSDMRPALQSRSESYEERIITAGVRVATNTVLVLGTSSFDTLRHELTHVVTAQAGESAFGTLPAWLDEGTAVYGQLDPGGFGEAVERAISRGNVLSLREISAYPGDPDKVNLFYGQSWSVVDYLVETYGEEQFARLFAEIKAGKRIDSALEAVYGFDQDGLDAEWREANGLPPREAPEPVQDDEPQQPSGDRSGGSSGDVIIGGVIAVLLLAALVGAGGVLLARRVS